MPDEPKLAGACVRFRVRLRALPVDGGAIGDGGREVRERTIVSVQRRMSSVIISETAPTAFLRGAAGTLAWQCRSNRPGSTCRDRRCPEYRPTTGSCA